MKTNKETTPLSDMDSGWKDVIEDFTEDFFRFYQPEMHRKIDFAQGVKFLDKELNEILSDSDNVRREADRLLDFDRPGLEKGHNPFAIITRVQLAKLKSEQDSDSRYSFRLDLTKELYSGNYTKEQIIRLYRFIDYVLKLPKPKALQFNKEMDLFEEEKTMPYISMTERMAREEGLLQGIQQGMSRGIQKGISEGMERGISEGIEQGRTRGQIEKVQEAVLEVLEVRFGDVPFAVKEEIICCNDLSRLNKAHRHALLIALVDEFEL
jgi:hypothetical protein